MEYRIFCKLADYFGVALGFQDTTLVGDWSRARTTVVSGLSEWLRQPPTRKKRERS